MARNTTPRTPAVVPARAAAPALTAAWGVRDNGRLIWRWNLRAGN
jgi:hypothetical protein